jgi:hypothetical protein
LTNSVHIPSEAKSNQKNTLQSKETNTQLTNTIRDEYVSSKTIQSANKTTSSTHKLAGYTKYDECFDNVMKSLGIQKTDWLSCGMAVDYNGQFQKELFFISYREGFQPPDIETVVEAFNNATIDGKSYGKMMRAGDKTLYEEGVYIPPDQDPKDSSDKSLSFKLPSFLTSKLKIQNQSTPATELIKETSKMLLEGVITRVLKSEGIELKDGDRISMTVNGKGQMSINHQASRIEGKTGEDIEDTCNSLEKRLNETEDEEGNSLGKAILMQFAEEKGYDFNEIWGDENFSMSFSFEYNAKQDRNEITNMRIVQENTEMLKAVNKKQKESAEKKEVVRQ